MQNYISEEDLDSEKILQRLEEAGLLQGDEDFEVFKCPSCHKIFLINHEWDDIFLDANDLTKSTGYNFLYCPNCRYIMHNKIIIGKKADNDFRVTRKQLQASAWHWILKKC